MIERSLWDRVVFSNLDHVSEAIQVSQSCFHEWNGLGFEERASKLDRLADLFGRSFN